MPVLNIVPPLAVLTHIVTAPVDVLMKVPVPAVSEATPIPPTTLCAIVAVSALTALATSVAVLNTVACTVTVLPTILAVVPVAKLIIVGEPSVAPLSCIVVDVDTA